MQCPGGSCRLGLSINENGDRLSEKHTILICVVSSRLFLQALLSDKNLTGIIFMQSSKTILTSDGTRIWITCYLPEKSNGKVIIIAPAIGVTHDFYHMFSRFYRQQGFTIIGFDYRGVGKSAPRHLKGFKANLHEWAVMDINSVILYAKYNFQHYEIIYIGHCIGGEIIGLVPASQYINKIVLVSSSLTCEKLWPWYHRLKLKIQKAVSRLLSWLFGYLPKNKIANYGKLPKGVANQFANWCDNPNGLFDNYPDNNYRKLKVPIVVYTFTDDWLCPPRAVKELLHHFFNASITWFHLHPSDIGLKRVGHLDFFYISMKSTLWESLLQWLNSANWKQEEAELFNLKTYLL
jgi:predicted alpha/beta hydrolase